MSNLDTIGTAPEHEQPPEEGAFDVALLKLFSSSQSIGAVASCIVSLAVVFVIWNHVPGGFLIPWITAHIGISLFSIARSRRWCRAGNFAKSQSARRLEVISWKATAGLLWGTLAVFSYHYLPQSLQFFTVIAVSAVSVGSISTMASIPAAARSFIILSIGPFIAFWLWSGDTPSIILGLLATILLAVILNSVHVAHGQIVSVLRAELDLHQLSDKFTAARGEWLELSDAAEAYVLFDQDAKLLSWNSRFVKIMQVPDELLRIGTPRTTLIRHSRQTIAVASGDVPVEQWLIQRTDTSSETTNVREYEGGIWLQRRVQRTDNGNIVVSFVDWTDLIQMETALRESEERYRLIAENSPDAIFIRSEDQIVYVNPTAVKMLNAKDERDLIGLQMMSLYHPGDHNIILDSRAKLTAKDDENSPFVRARMRRLDGSYVMTAGSGARHIWQGKPAILVTRRDITDQVEAENRLRESESRYRRIAELSPVAVIIRMDDQIVYANSSAVKMFGAESEADLLYESLISFAHPDDRQRVLDNRASITEDQATLASPIRVRRRRFDGRYFLGEGSGGPFVWQGQPASIVMIRDVTPESEAVTEMPEDTQPVLSGADS